MLPKNRLQTFISYSRANQQFAIRLASELKAAGFCVWMDQFDIPTGARWDDEIEKALRESQIFLFIMTPASIASKNARDEAGYAIDHGKRILPVLLEACEVPLRLSRVQYVDFTRMKFDEGIQRAKELLANLVKEIEGASPETAGGEKGTHSDKEITFAVQEPKTIPTGSRSIPSNVQIGIRQRKRNLSKPIAAGIAILFVGALAAGMLIYRPDLFAAPPMPSPTLILPTPTVFPTNVPEPTSPPPTVPPMRSFTEDFVSADGRIMNWTPRLRHGNAAKEKNFHYESGDGGLKIELTQQYIWSYFLYDPSVTYSSVEMEVVVADLRSTEIFGLVCQFGDSGWYEFDINGGGEYFIRYVDSINSDRDEAEFLIAYGAIRNFKYSTDKSSENSIRAKCDGSRLSLSVNDLALKQDFPSRKKLDQGQIGFTLRSFENYPADILVKSITVKEP